MNKGKKTNFGSVEAELSASEQRLKEFEMGGRAQLASETVSPYKGGPPSTASQVNLSEETRRMVIALRTHDLNRLEDVLLRWKRETGVSGGVKVTHMLRTLLSVALPLIEEMDAVRDEKELGLALKEALAALLIIK